MFRLRNLALLGGFLLAGAACGFGRLAEENASAMASPGFTEALPGFPHIAAPTALEGPLRIGIQPGHWRVEELPDELAAAVSAAFRETGLPEDVNGVTANMRGYFGFSWWRFDNSLSPHTPAVLVELGFMGNAADRARMLEKPDLYAAVLHPARYAGATGTAARAAPSREPPSWNDTIRAGD